RVGGNAGHADGRDGARGADAPADRHQRGEATGVLEGQLPRPVAAHREAGEIDARRVAAELVQRGIQGLHRGARRRAAPDAVARRLWQHHDRRERLGPALHDGAEPDHGPEVAVRPPLAFAWYIAASALAISVSGVSPCAGHSATPIESDIRPSPNVSPATRARIRSATRAAVVTVVSSSTTRNSSPP